MLRLSVYSVVEYKTFSTQHLTSVIKLLNRTHS